MYITTALLCSLGLIKLMKHEILYMNPNDRTTNNYDHAIQVNNFAEKIG